MTINKININEDADHRISLEGVNLNFSEIFTGAPTEEIGRKVLAGFLGNQVFWQRYENERLMFENLNYSPRMWYSIGFKEYHITDRYLRLSDKISEFTYEDKLRIIGEYYLANEYGFIIGENGELLDKMTNIGLVDTIEDKKEAVYMNLLMQDISIATMLAERNGLSIKGSRSALAKKITNHDYSLNSAIDYFASIGIKSDVYMKMKAEFSLQEDEYFTYLQGIAYLFAHHYIMNCYKIRDSNMVIGIESLIWGYRISIIGDCPICNKFNGYRKDAVEMPIHIGCTCCQQTILKVVAEREGLSYS